jgi:2-phospho-L-lactate/phosphoenolpyruvate guanylyltransferase
LKRQAFEETRSIAAVRVKDDIWAVVPVKQLSLAKSRLSPAFSRQVRQELAYAMLADVLTALADVPALAGIIVATLDEDAARLAGGYGAEIFSEAADEGHTKTVMAAAARLARDGRGGMLTMPGDIPAVTAAEIASLLRGHGMAPAFSIVPAHDRRGSNAIVMTPPECVPLAFGNDSFVPHLAAARRLGIAPRIVEAAGIALDIDSPDDIAKLRAWPVPTRAAAFLARVLDGSRTPTVNAE